jgi:mono/diheme cytochrome c family protein
MRSTTLASMLVALCAAALPSQAQEARLVERGKYLMNSVVACGNCHVQRDDKGAPLFDRGLSGGMVFDEAPFKAVAPNITPDAETGIGKWSEAQLVKAIREGIRPDGSLIGPPMPIAWYRGMSDLDAKAIAAYLRAQPAVRHLVPRSVYKIKLPANYGPPITREIAAPSPTDKVLYGAYLAGPLGHCMDCHTPEVDGRSDLTRLGAGGNSFEGPWGVSVSRNLTPHASGLAGVSDAQIARAIRQGLGRDGSPLKPPMAFDWYKNIAEADMTALIAYLRSLPPQPFAAPK